MWIFGVIAMASTLAHSGVASAQSDESEPELEVTISSPNIEYKVGDEIPIIFTVTNVGESPYTFSTRSYDRGGRMEEYVLTATRADGSALADPRKTWTGGIGGGLGGEKVLAKGDSGTMTIALNRWCVITEAGQLSVQGMYYGYWRGAHESFASPTIDITVLPRSRQAMAEHIRQLQSEAATSFPKDSREKREERARMVRRLMYTHDAAIAPILIDLWYDWEDTSFWIVEAFSYYIPQEPDMYELIRDAALNRGLKQSMLHAMLRIGPSNQHHADIVGRALASDDLHEAVEAAKYAQYHWSDSFVPALRKIATDKTLNEFARIPAINAIGLGPSATETRDEILRSLLDDSSELIQTLAKTLLEEH